MARSRRPDWVSVGRITAPHGLDGAVRVLPMTDVEGRFDTLEQATLLRPGQTERQRVTISRVAYKGNMVLLWFREISNRNEAETYRNALIQVPGAELPPLPDDTYYVVDLVGLSVETVEGRLLGQVTDVIQAGGANDVYVVRAEPSFSQREILIPAIRQVVREVNLAKGRIVVDPLPGMLDD